MEEKRQLRKPVVVEKKEIDQQSILYENMLICTGPEELLEECIISNMPPQGSILSGSSAEDNQQGIQDNKDKIGVINNNKPEIAITKEPEKLYKLNKLGLFEAVELTWDSEDEKDEQGDTEREDKEKKGEINKAVSTRSGSMRLRSRNRSIDGEGGSNEVKREKRGCGGKEKRRRKGEEEEDISEAALSKRHSKYEKVEKRIRTREIELYEFHKYQQQVADQEEYMRSLVEQEGKHGGSNCGYSGNCTDNKHNSGRNGNGKRNTRSGRRELEQEEEQEEDNGNGDGNGQEGIQGGHEQEQEQEREREQQKIKRIGGQYFEYKEAQKRIKVRMGILEGFLKLRTKEESKEYEVPKYIKK